MALIFLVAVVGVSYGLTWWAKRIAQRQQIIDIPNERSSHTRPTPRGGGIGIVISFFWGLIVLAIFEVIAFQTLVALLGSGTLVAVIGYLDDRREISTRVRFVVHLLSSAWLVFFINGIPHLSLGFTTLEWGILGDVVIVLGCTWMINLYNFMDGIDGIAGLEAVFVGTAGAGLMLAWGHVDISMMALLLVAGSIGFLLWNMPPAKIFMGDVGSGFVGLMIAGLAIKSAQAEPVSLWVWIILAGVFVIDTFVTLVRRAFNGNRITEAHRTHAYQHLASLYGSHFKVLALITAVNVLWLLPWIMFVFFQPSLALAAVVTSLVPLAWLAIMLKAGRTATA